MAAGIGLRSILNKDLYQLFRYTFQNLEYFYHIFPYTLLVSRIVSLLCIIYFYCRFSFSFVCMHTRQ